MKTPSRREFFTYAAAATLASALPASTKNQTKSKTKNQTKTDTTVLPLVVDVIGPMAFRWSRLGFDLWMPHLDATTGKPPSGNKKGNGHESGIMTPVMGFALEEGDYKISGTDGSNDNPPPPHPTRNSQIYHADTSEVPKQYFIHISLPVPFNIVLLDPELARIWSNGNKPPDDYTYYAVGLRLLYPAAGVPALSRIDGKALLAGAPKDGVIQFEPGPAEKQLDMSITYSAIHADDPNDAKDSFMALAKLLKLNLNIEFPQLQDASRQRPCKGLVVRINAST